ncbi:hypothetical protein DFH08DRAFT_1036471 [Mycena albidolilacea]|uniref:Uncharacterized protein n=1 Tax=Mycena albidolilacea TaxID=1033008 RepID=A0AAD6ZDE5_9AGAR|nr:hypothetical protein DFH08DRAFT_1036471 [Mycena albidolilacea]
MFWAIATFFLVGERIPSPLHRASCAREMVVPVLAAADLSHSIQDDKPLACDPLRPPGWYLLFCTAKLGWWGWQSLRLLSPLAKVCTGHAAFGLRWSSLDSVERIYGFTPGAASLIESQRPLAYRPSSAANTSLVMVEDLNLKYAPDLPSVLQVVSFELKAGERVRLVG